MRPRSGRLNYRLILGTCIFAAAAAPRVDAQGRGAGNLSSQGRVEQGNGLYSLPRFQDEIAALNEATTEIENGDLESAVPRLQALLTRRSTGVIAQQGGLDLYTGLRLTTIEMIRNLPSAGLQAYERLVRRQAAHLPQDPTQVEDREVLLQWAWNFPCSRPGLEARIRLGDLALIEGNGIEAQLHFRAAEDAMPPSSSLAGGLAHRRRTADFLVRHSHGLTMTDEVAATAVELGGAIPPGDSSYWPGYGGIEGTRPMSDPVGENELIAEIEVVSPNFDQNPFAMHLSGDMSAVYVNDGLSVWALNMLKHGTAEVLWRATGPMVRATQTLSKTRRGVNTSMVLAAAVSPNIIVASLQVPHELAGASDNQRFRGGVEIIQKLPVRRLFAFDRSSGKKIWAHWDRSGGPISESFDGHEAATSPLILGDTVYVASHQQTGAITYYLTAYDLYSGKSKWRRLICTSQQEVNMFGNTNMEFAASPLAVSGGVIYGTTNLGVCFAANAESGEIRWIRGYEVIPLPPTRLRGQRPRPIYFANNPAVVSDGVMVCTPLDSEYVLGLDCKTGKLLWRQLHQQGEIELRWLLGSLNGEFILAGRGILAIAPRSGNARLAPKARVIATAETLGENSSDAGYAVGIPRGALSADRIYFLGSTRTLSVLDSKGNRDPRTSELQISGRAGNLFLQDGMMMLINNGSVRSYGDIQAMRRLAERTLRSGIRDPAAYLKFAALLRASAIEEPSGTLEARAESLYAEGLQLARDQGLGNQSPIYRKLAEGLFELALEGARRLRTVNPERALRTAYRARERALLPHQWLEAQAGILDLTEDDAAKHLAELELMASRYGHLEFEFKGFGTVPVAAYCLWQSIPVAPSAESAAERCQEVLERFGNVRLGNQLAGDLAAETLTAMIEAAGRKIYAGIEQRATRSLAQAGDDRSLLGALVNRFPQSMAADRATAKLLDLAALAGDLHAATRSFAESARRDQPGAGVMRRMMLAAESKGNLALAHTFADRLLSQHADEVSDFPKDQGATYRDVAQALPSLSDVLEPEYDKPARELSHIAQPNQSIQIHYKEIEVVPGFGSTSLPIFFTTEDDRLHAFSTDPLPQSLADARFQLPMSSFGGSAIMLCGQVAVICEDQRARGVDLESGRVLWTRSSPEARTLTSLGICGGVLHLYSGLHTSGDGGRLQGIEPITGAVLFELRFPNYRSNTPPVASNGYLWSLVVDESEAAPWIARLDPLTGKTVSRTEIPTTALHLLGHADRRSRLRRADFQKRMFANSRAIFLPLLEGDDNAPPRLIALDHSGRMLWSWVGHRDGRLIYAATHGEDVVMLEQGRVSRLIVLDRNGKTKHSNEVGSYARVTNASYVTARKHDAPEVLLITSHKRDENSASLTCWSLDRTGPRFREQFRTGVQRVWKNPQLGADFITVPVMMESTRLPEILVLDLKTRRGALAKGRSSPPMRKLSPPITLYRHGPFTVVETIRDITILGK